jgi:putative nucleotidyltransferase with HDIG domain
MNISLELPKDVETLMDAFRKAGYQIFVVGGALRDCLLQRETYDWDFATNATPEDMLKLFPDAKYENTFGTVIVPSATGDTVFEATPFRKEGRYSDSRHPDTIEWADAIEEDLARRDFTINALAYDGTHLVDVVGGKKDIEDKIIRAVGDPAKRFEEDALRMMRAIRFAAQLGFTVDPQTLRGIEEQADLIRSISWERIHDEFIKTLAVPSANSAADAILLMRQTGILAKIIPELNRCFGVEQQSPERHHIHDVGTHLVETLRHCPSSHPVVRLAALIHDIGKAETRAVDPETGITTFYNHEIVGATIANTIAERMRFSKEDRYLLVKLVRYHMFSVGEMQTDKAVRRFIRRIGKEHIQDMLDLRTADRIGSGATETSWRTELFKKRIEEVQKKPFEIRDLAINGLDVMKELKLQPGPQVGQILGALFEEVADGKVPNERDHLMERVRSMRHEN